MRRRLLSETPRMDVSGFGQGIRAIIEDMNPSCKTIGRPDIRSFMA